MEGSITLSHGLAAVTVTLIGGTGVDCVGSRHPHLEGRCDDLGSNPPSSVPATGQKGSPLAVGIPARLLRWQFVKNGPESSDLFDRVEEISKGDRFDDIGVDAKLVALNKVGLLAGGG